MSHVRLDDATRLGQRAILDAESRIRLSDAQWATRVAKREHDFATDLDIAVERAMREVLSEGGAVAATVLGEELGGDADLRTGAVWVIDPIDGTTNLIRGIPTFTVTLALMVDGIATLAFVAAPLLSERYLAVRGGGAYAEVGDQRKPMRVSDESELSGALVSINDIAGLPDPARVLAGERTGAIAGEALQVRCHGSIALDLAWVAAGRLDACVAFSNRPWDVQAGALLVREAGGAVYDGDGTEHQLASQLTVASNSNLKAALVDHLGLLCRH